MKNLRYVQMAKDEESLCRLRLLRDSSSQRMIEAIEPRTMLSAGEFDPTFGSGGIVTLTPQTGLTLSVGGAAVQNDGKVLVSVENAIGSVATGDISTPTSGEILRLLTDGSPDPAFGID